MYFYFFFPFDVWLKYEPDMFCSEIHPQISPHTVSVQDLFSAKQREKLLHWHTPVLSCLVKDIIKIHNSFLRSSPVMGFYNPERLQLKWEALGTNPLWKWCHSGQNTARLKTNVSGMQLHSLSATTTLNFWQQKWVMASAVCICLWSQSNSEPLGKIAVPHVFSWPVPSHQLLVNTINKLEN